MNAVRNQPQDASSTIDPASVRIRLTQALDERVFYLATYQARMDGQNVDCIYLYETFPHPRAGGWVVGSGGGSCSPPGPNGAHGGGQSSSQDAQRGLVAHTEAYGQVSSPDIVKVQVDWTDGQVQEAPVINGYYLLVRDGLIERGDIRFLNAAGETVETLIHETAPGKQ